MGRVASVAGSLVLGLAVGLASNFHVIAMSAVFVGPAPGFVVGAIGTAGITGLMTAFGLLVNHLSWDVPVRISRFVVPFSVGVFAAPAYAFGSVLAGVVASAVTGAILLGDVAWRRRTAARRGPGA